MEMKDRTILPPVHGPNLAPLRVCTTRPRRDLTQYAVHEALVVQNYVSPLDLTE